jgi:signal transduction histidine kinase
LVARLTIASQNVPAAREALLESLAVSRGGMRWRAAALIAATLPVVLLLGAPLLFIWLALLIIWDAALIKPLERNWVLPVLDTNLPLARLRRASMVLFGLSLTQVLPVVAWMSNTAFGALAAAAWVMCAATQVFVYYSRDRLLLIAGMVPNVACVLVGPSLNGISLESSVTSLFLLSALAAGAAFVSRSDALIAKAAKEASARLSAEAASHAKSRFIANMHHELRTPLNAIIGYTEMLHETAVEEGRNDDIADLERVLAAARLQLIMMSDLLAFSELQDGRSEIHYGICDVAALARDAAESVREAIEANGNTLTLDMGDHLADVRTDPAKLRHCLEHLLANAGKFTRHGEVRLTLRRERGGQRDWLVAAVADTGIGIPSDRIAYIFEPFAQADDSDTRGFDGAGIGLAITSRYARLLGGAVTVESTPGRGSVFTLRVRTDLAAGRERISAIPGSS